MNYRRDNQIFNTLLDQYHNPYKVVKLIAHKARKLCAYYDNAISHSEALTHVINATSPDIDDIYSRIHRKSYKDATIDNVLELVDDVDIKLAVRNSVYTSIKHDHLIYKYNSVSDANKTARVRILTNMVWDALYKYRRE